MDPEAMTKLASLANEGRWTEMCDLLSTWAHSPDVGLDAEYGTIVTKERKKRGKRYKNLNDKYLAHQAKKVEIDRSLKALEEETLAKARGGFLDEARGRLLATGNLSGESASCRRLVEEAIAHTARRLSEAALPDPIKDALYPDREEWIEQDELIEMLVIASIEFGDLLDAGDIPEWELEITTTDSIARFWRRTVAEAAVDEYHRKIRAEL